MRENQRLLRREPLDEIVNRSVNQTLGRTIITSGTTFLAVLALLSVRRGSAARVCVHDARRHHHRHVLDGFIAAAIAIILSRRMPSGVRAPSPTSTAVRPAEARRRRRA